MSNKASKVPEEYKAAFAEADRLFDAGELNSMRFDPLYDKASKAIEGLPFAVDLIESLLLIAPQDWLDTNTEHESE